MLRGMFKIGDFSKFTRVSVKMLRHYDEIGLLKPARIDAATGYRFYAADQLPRLNRIILLKDLGFKLDQIADLLDGDLTAEQIRGMLRLRHAEIEQQLLSLQLRLALIEARLENLEQETPPAVHAAHDVILRDVPPQLMATRRQVVPEPGAPIARLFDEVEAYVVMHRARAFTSPLTIFHDQEYRETQLDIEVAVPVNFALPSNERVTVRELPGALMACAVYTGGYEKMAEIYNTLLRWLDAQKFTIAGPVREVYLRFGADNPESLNLPQAFLTNDSRLYVTEVQLPVQKWTSN
jgi:DNA-binding transcriptional MerR regulator